MDYQKLIFDWVAGQPGLVGATIFAAGLVFGLSGFRFARGLVLLPLLGLGYLGGLVLAGLTGLPAGLTALGAGVLCGAGGLALPRTAIAASGGATWGALGGYLAIQIGLPDPAPLIALCLCAASGAVLMLVSRAPMTVLLTAVQGAALQVVGFVGLASALVPTLGSTFRALAHGQALVAPVLLTMLAVVAYSFQASQRQGDIITGAEGSPMS